MNEFQEVFRSTLQMRWGDMDAFGHVNNTVYFAYMQQVRIEWMESFGLPVPPGHGPVMLNAHMNFRKQLHYPGRLLCVLLAKPPGRSSIETRFELRREDDPQTLYADGGAVLVWANVALGKSSPLPDALRALLPKPKPKPKPKPIELDPTIASTSTTS